MARGGWQHIAVSFDQTSRKVKFYVNGALDSEKNMGTSAVNAVTALLVGSHKNIGTMDPHSMKGDVDDIRVYDATLTDDQAAAIYAEQGTALARKQLGTLVSQADALLAAERSTPRRRRRKHSPRQNATRSTPWTTPPAAPPRG